MRISDWSSDVCSSDLIGLVVFSLISGKQPHYLLPLMPALMLMVARGLTAEWSVLPRRRDSLLVVVAFALLAVGVVALPVVIGQSPYLAAKLDLPNRSEEHTSELQSLMRISYAVFCLKKKKKKLRTQI